MKYCPIQLNRKLDYNEVQPPIWLAGTVVCYWQINTHEKDIVYPIIPDGCVDLVINCSEDIKTFISPSLKNANTFNLGQNEIWYGIRFCPGALSRVLSIDLSELHYQTIELENINSRWNKYLKELLVWASGFEERVKVSNRFLCDFGLSDAVNKNGVVAEVINSIYQTKGNVMLKNYNSKTFSTSERHIRRLFSQHVGLSPKRFARIVRSQFFLSELVNNHKSKCYYDSYFDQAHMIREIKEMTGATPKQLIKQFY